LSNIVALLLRVGVKKDYRNAKRPILPKAHTNTQTQTQTPTEHTHKHTNTNTNTNAHSLTHTRTHTQTHTHTHTHSHTLSLTQKHADVSGSSDLKTSFQRWRCPRRTKLCRKQVASSQSRQKHHRVSTTSINLRRVIVPPVLLKQARPWRVRLNSSTINNNKTNRDSQKMLRLSLQ
jgi:hypothetical protein